MGMKDGECPECGSDDIHFQKNGVLQSVLAMFQPFRITIYACAECGYVAEFLEEKHRLYIAKNWEAMNKSKRKNDA